MTCIPQNIRDWMRLEPLDFGSTRCKHTHFTCHRRAASPVSGSWCAKRKHSALALRFFRSRRRRSRRSTQLLQRGAMGLVEQRKVPQKGRLHHLLRWSSTPWHCLAPTITDPTWEGRFQASATYIGPSKWIGVPPITNLDRIGVVLWHFNVAHETVSDMNQNRDLSEVREHIPGPSK